MAEKLEAGDIFNRNGLTYLVIGGKNSLVANADGSMLTGWLVTYTEFTGTDDHDFAKLSRCPTTAFQFVSSGATENTLGEVEVLDKYEWMQFGWKKKP